MKDNKSKLQELLQIPNPPREVREAIDELRTIVGEDEAEAEEQYRAALRADALHCGKDRREG